MKTVWRIALCLSVFGLGMISLLATAITPAKADGGLIIPDDTELWASLQETEQTAVVRLSADNTVTTDLIRLDAGQDR